MREAEALIALNLLPGLGPVRIRRLLDRFGTAGAALAAQRSEIGSVKGFGAGLTDCVARWEAHVDLPRELRRIREVGAEVTTITDPEYPETLRQIYDPPIVLYRLGELRPTDRHAVGVVGSRRATHYGIKTAKMLGFQLASSGLTIVSGLARGIDTAAHEAAVAAGGRTVAVIGSGLGRLYPPENAPLAEKIARGHGAVVSEFPIDYNPDKQSFPLRNRIVAGWGHGVVVVEAPKRSGALITVNQALDYSRSVYAVPGPIDRPTSQGTNGLIQSGAKLVTCAEDVLEDMENLFPTPVAISANSGEAGGSQPAKTGDRTPGTGTLSDVELLVYNALDGSECTIDSLLERTGLTSNVVSTTLLRLEMKHLVKQLPGSYFVKMH